MSFNRLAHLAASVALSMPLLTQAQSDPLKTAAAEAGAVTTETGLVYRSLKDGRGASPIAADTVKVHYRGTLADGTEFDSSVKGSEKNLVAEAGRETLVASNRREVAS